MSWLKTVPLPTPAQTAFSAFLTDLDAQLSDPSTNRSELVCELLAQFQYGRTLVDLRSTAPLVALALDPRNTTLEAEYYVATDMEKFARVKPLLWLWKCFDLTPAGQNPALGIPFRAILAKHIFKRVGRDFKCWQNVEFSVGYNLEVGDDVVIHRHVLLDDIGGIKLGHGVSVSDYVNIYSHTHSVLETADVTLKETLVGDGVRITYHATVLAGSVLSDDSMIATGSLVNRPVEPHAIAMGIPARVRFYKSRAAQKHYSVDSRTGQTGVMSKGNTQDYPLETPVQTQEEAPVARVESLV